MINNKMSLRNLLIILLLATAFLFGCFGYGINLSRGGRDDLYFSIGFAVACMLLLILSGGIYWKQNWARVLTLGMLYMIGLGFGVLGFFLISNVIEKSHRDDVDEMYLFFPLLFFSYVILGGVISILKNDKLKEEFEN